MMGSEEISIQYENMCYQFLYGFIKNNFCIRFHAQKEDKKSSQRAVNTKHVFSQRFVPGRIMMCSARQFCFAGKTMMCSTGEGLEKNGLKEPEIHLERCSSNLFSLLA